MFFLFCQYNWHHNHDIKNINYKQINQNSCFIFGVAIKLNFINTIVGLESDETSFDAIRFLRIQDVSNKSPLSLL